jgi:malate dehydrogenase (oxaloacetate-decarboxylating)(NADP+)
MLSHFARLGRNAATTRTRQATIPSSSSSSSLSLLSGVRFVSNTPPTEDASLAPWNVPEEIPSEGEWAGCRRNFMAPIHIGAKGVEILTNPLFNKGTAFKSGERDRLRIRGLLPAKIFNIALQKERFLIHLRSLESNIRKNILLEDLHDRNETLYHRVLVDHMEEMAPLIYTPTVGQACQEYGQRFRRPRGMYFTEDDRGQMAAMVYNWPHKDVHVIVVTDGSRILGLGDLGANGMGIPIGKLSLYCAAGGIAPHRVLPVVLDVGTDNQELLEDDLYMGVPKPRLRGKEYYHLVDEFMGAVRYRWPNALVQFEDFDSSVAQRLLDKYRQDHLCFNDDIQGTGATTLAGLLGALRAKGEDVTSLGDQRIAIAGAGSAGIGIAQVLYQAMLEQGCSEEKANNAFYVVDQNG